MTTLSVPIILRNCVKHQYPLFRIVDGIYELADEIVLSVDPTSEDSTLSYIYDMKRLFDSREISPSKIKIIQSVWDLNNINRDGTELSKQTNIAIEECSGDWIFSLQADETAHEKDFDTIRKDIEEAEARDIDAFSFIRLYFYGDIQTIRRDWTTSIVRLFKKGKRVSCGDAMNTEGSGPVSNSSAYIYHYSRIGDPAVISKRILALDKLFHPAEKLLTEKELNKYDFSTYNFDCMHREDFDVGRKKEEGNLFVKFYGTHPRPFLDYK